MALTVVKAWWRGDSRWAGLVIGGGSLASLEMVLACWACEHCTSMGLNSLWGDACVWACVCASGDVIIYGPGTSIFRKWSSGLRESSFPGPRPGSPGEAGKKAEAACHLAVKSNELSCGIPQRRGWEMLGGAGRVCILCVWAGRVWCIPEETRRSFCGWSSLGRFQTPGNGTQVHSQATGEGPRAPRGLASNCIWHS